MLPANKTSGYIYIISNPSHKGWLKIGVTENIQDRLHVYQTSDPNRNYKVEYYISHPDCYKAEKQIKEMMKYFALNIKNEWFECDLGVAKVRLDETLEDLK
jgi:predicted GIY-YIG superfamily endonuclease